MLGGTRAPLRRIAPYDSWQNKVRRLILGNPNASLLPYNQHPRQPAPSSPSRPA